jgi:hypothetical protein
MDDARIPRRQIHADKGVGADTKYSRWRRERFIALEDRTNCYCMDLDWVEWRRGDLAALIETRRALAGKTQEQAVQEFATNQNGFQLECLARLAYCAKVPAYVVSILDPEPESDTYEKASFLVLEVSVPAVWPAGKLNLERDLPLVKVGTYGEKAYADFIAGIRARARNRIDPPAGSGQEAPGR